MLSETRLGAAVDNAELDSSVLVDLIVQSAQLASDQPEIVELDLNPVVASDGAAAVTDAVIRLERAPTTTGPIRRL